jgi:hypothetical protein
VQLRLVSCSCLQAVLNTVVWACTGFVQHGNTAKYSCKACLTASTHANRHAHLYSSVLQLSRVQLRLFAIYSGYCRMHRVCAACLETGLQPARSTIPTQHFQIGAVMSASMLGSLSCSYAGVCCWLLVVALLLPAQGLCTKPTQPGTACWYV